MPDILTADERALIDAAVKAGAVQRIPTGQSATRVVYEDGKLVVKGAEAGGWRGHVKASPKRGGKQPSPTVAERRQKVRALAVEGKTGPEIAEALGMKVSTVYFDLRSLDVSLQRRASQSPAPGVVAPARIAQNPQVAASREAVKRAFDGKRTIPDIARLTGVHRRTVKDHLEALGLTAPKAKPGQSRTRAAKERQAKVREMAERGMQPKEIAEALAVSRATISYDCQQLGLTFRRKRDQNETATQRKERRAAAKVAEIKDRRRFTAGIPASGKIARIAPADATGTQYPKTVRDPDTQVLKHGVNSGKIGGQVLVGWLKGAAIYTLTLEERATCPRSCSMWQGCYGNSMDKAHRYRHGPALMARLAEEIEEIAARGQPFLVRLHVLGDFWSRDYVDFWRDQLDRHETLHVFGFTAHQRGTDIGDAVALLRGRDPIRFSVRHSGTTGLWGSFTIDFPTQRKTIGDAIVCPAQLDANEGSPRKVHCGSCAACWSTDRPITFIEH